MPISPNTPIWIPVNNRPILYADFITHLNYLDCISHYSQNLSVSLNRIVSGAIIESAQVRKKVKLVELTLENLREEYKKIKQFPDYSEICVSWVPVKAYYLIFNLLLLLEYFLENDDRIFIKDHKKVKDKFSVYLRNKDLSFNCGEFNSCYNANVILNWSIPPGNNIIRSNPNYSLLLRQIIKKLLDYKKDDFKRIKGVQSLRGANKTNFINSSSVNVCEFFYWYRIKANYRDMEFIDSGVPVNEFFDFYSKYFSLVDNFYSAFKPIINRLSLIRVNRAVLTA